MELPKSVKVQSVRYQIKRVGDRVLQDKTGECRYDKNVIYIHKDIPDEQAWLTLWHEVWHAANSQMSEEHVEWLANATYSILKENKWMKEE